MLHLLLISFAFTDFLVFIFLGTCMKSLFVASTCICRPSIHNYCFGRLLEFLTDCPNVHFIFNIDNVSGLDRCSQEDTMNNLKNLVESHSKTCEFFLPETPCFFSATKRVLFRAKELMGDNQQTGLLWFEDDKYFKKDPNLVRVLSEPQTDTVHHFWKKSAQQPTFHPCYWGWRAATAYFFPAFDREAQGDPELIMMKYWKDNYKEGDLCVSYYITHSTDVGREWQSKNNIKKWVREKMNNVAVTYV